jgi:hypothetical protein
MALGHGLRVHTATGHVLWRVLPHGMVWGMQPQGMVREVRMASGHGFGSSDKRHGMGVHTAIGYGVGSAASGHGLGVHTATRYSVGRSAPQGMVTLPWVYLAP